MKTIRFAVLSSGIYWQSPGLRQAGINPDILYYRKRLPPLSRYDVLVIPKGLPASYLTRVGPAISSFLEHDGGVVLTFGEFRGDWCKDVSWIPASGSRQIKVSTEMASMFRCPNGCMQRRDAKPDGHEFPGAFDDWVLAPHGEYNTLPQSAVTLAYPDVEGATNENPVAFVQRFTNGGVLLAMTLDPDYHTYQGSDCASCLLNMIIGWAKETVKSGRQQRAVRAQSQGAWEQAVTELKAHRKATLSRDVVIGVGLGVLAHAVSILIA